MGTPDEVMRRIYLQGLPIRLREAIVCCKKRVRVVDPSKDRPRSLIIVCAKLMRIHRENLCVTVAMVRLAAVTRLATCKQTLEIAGRDECCQM